MKLQHKLLEHPFYQAWEKGEISNEQISVYAKSYNEFITNIPVFWNTVITAFDVKSEQANKVISEETEHISLWQKWSEKLPATGTYPPMESEIEAFAKMNPSQLLGAIHAFEIQQPEVARTKKAGLLKHYGFKEEDTKYFDEHMNEHEHIKFGEELRDKYTDKKDFEYGFNEGARLIYHSLDRFVD